MCDLIKSLVYAISAIISLTIIYMLASIGDADARGYKIPKFQQAERIVNLPRKAIKAIKQVYNSDFSVNSD